jgi:hypothetical protein
MNTEICQEELWVWTPGGGQPEYTEKLPECLFLKLSKAMADFESVQDEIREHLEAK